MKWALVHTAHSSDDVPFVAGSGQRRGCYSADSAGGSPPMMCASSASPRARCSWAPGARAAAAEPCAAVSAQPEPEPERAERGAAAAVGAQRPDGARAAGARRAADARGVAGRRGAR